MVDNHRLIEFMRKLCSTERDVVSPRLASTPGLATARLVRGEPHPHRDEFFLAACSAQIYVGHTALHVAAAAYRTPVARSLVAYGADVRARNRRGAEPLHAAVGGAPGSPSWDPSLQVEVINYLIDAGADVDAAAAGGVTPLHRAARNRCSAAVEVLLAAGADPLRSTAGGSTALSLAQRTTGRGGTGSPEARREQVRILDLLAVAD